jgi:hypothetical protein
MKRSHLFGIAMLASLAVMASESDALTGWGPHTVTDGWGPHTVADGWGPHTVTDGWGPHTISA